MYLLSGKKIKTLQNLPQYEYLIVSYLNNFFKLLIYCTFTLKFKLIYGTVIQKNVATRGVWDDGLNAF